MSKTAASSLPNFNSLARIYQCLEALSFGPSLSLCRNAFLPQANQARRSLVLGDGDGRFTARILDANPDVHVHAVDASPAMLAALIRRAGSHTARLTTEQADLRAWMAPTTEAYDLIATHFFLDCLTSEEVYALAAKLRAVAAPSALWLVSDFSIPPSAFGALIAHPIVSTLYRVFALLTGLAVSTLPDHPAALRAAGFTLLERRTRLGGLLASELWRATPHPVADPRLH